ncbi:Serine/threonine-protein kinase SCH9 [Psilocybe cubensis]|uniref:Serine/threonine-protein kinase SCH9 n=2 Tax=Psilocybe cubensis TaxID=181762 RepID=A0ACB8H497_PSICU|nr:Serine/threonine-protein kinase SCH9 [Psilocybe cubensis]KAH9482608.1 Serine/threonine-protein kinase SCH9 [Psilocybe cubensis]
MEDDETGAKRQIRLEIADMRMVWVPAMAVTTGAAIGLMRGGREASLRFLAENAHRPPTTVQGWYFYKKTKNYKVMLGAVKGAGRDGGLVAGIAGGYMGLEWGLEQVGWGSVKEVGAGIGTAVGFSAISRLPMQVARRTVALGAVYGLVMKGLGWMRGGVTAADGIRGEADGVDSRYNVERGIRNKLWPDPQLTPRPQEKNPFECGPVHPLLSPALFPPASPVPAAADPTPAHAAQPTTQLSLHAPVFKMQQPPPPKNQLPTTSPQAAISRGQIHVKLIQARALSVRAHNARPYCVVQFEQNEFVSRDPIPESDKEVKGKPVILSRQTSSNAISALDAIGSRHDASRKNSRGSKDSSPSTSLVSAASKALSFSHQNNNSSGISNGLFGRISPNNPAWKHEVSFDVTSEEELITVNVYDRAVSDQGFLGTVQIKPVLIHDHTVDQWYKLRPLEDEIVSGEIRIQVTYEAYKTKRALTPRDFEFLKLIGRGTFGKVFQVRKKDTKRIYAMKVLSKKEIVAKKEVAHTIGERKILQRSLDSPFLVGLKFSFQTDTDLYLVTDFKSGGELFWHLQRETRFSEDRARFYIAELILALEHLHKFNIVYRDLKPENILLDATGHVALCDFGLSKADLRPDELTTTFCGTTEYLAPEILLDEQGYSKIVDFWSLGVLLFEMCCGWSPFYAEDTQQMYKNICFGKIRFPKGVINDEGKQFVKGLLNRNPKHRLGAVRDAEELKEHPFFKGIDWVALAQKKVTPPFKPVVESDESTNNFDPEFTSADIRDIGMAEIMGMDHDQDLDDDDPSEAWVSQSFNVNGHTPNGPLGSERPKPTSPLGTITNGTSYSSSTHTNGNTTTPRSQGIQIKRPKRAKEPAGSPLTNSVQENFRGFTYHGGESVGAPLSMFAASRRRAAEEEAVADEEAPEVTTEDEIEDVGRSAGRYANNRRNGRTPMFDDDDMLS